MPLFDYALLIYLIIWVLVILLPLEAYAFVFSTLLISIFSHVIVLNSVTNVLSFLFPKTFHLCSYMLGVDLVFLLAHVPIQDYHILVDLCFHCFFLLFRILFLTSSSACTLSIVFKYTLSK